MVFRQLTDLHYLKHKKKINTLCGQDEVSSDISTNGTFSYHHILKVLFSEGDSLSIYKYFWKSRDNWRFIDLVEGKCKSKVHPRTVHEGPLTLTSALDRSGWSKPCPNRFTPGERPRTHCIGGWVGTRPVMYRCGKSLSPSGFDLRTVQRVASRYIDCDIPAHRPHGIQK